MMKKFRIVGIIFVVAVSEQVVSQSIYVPLDHQVYPLLFKAEAMGLFDSFSLRNLPITRTETLTLLHTMSSARVRLSDADAELLDQMIGEFTDPPRGSPAAPENERHLYRYEEGNTQIFIDLRGTQEVVLQKGRADRADEQLSQTTVWGMVRGVVGNQIAFGSSAYISMLLGSKEKEERFDVVRGPTQVLVGNSLLRDQASGYITFLAKPLTLTLGRTHTAWGSTADEQLGLSALNEPMDQIKFTLEFRRFRFTYLHAKLNGITTDRYLAGHRLDIDVGQGIRLGVYETVVYAGRGVELGYLNPLVPYHIIEHQLGDLDNNTFGIDITGSVTDGIRAYAEIFVDDFSQDYPLGTYWGNKLAYLAGFQWARAFGVSTFELGLSYTRVDPFVYTHYDSSLVYTHYDASIGSRLGPNAERYLVSARMRPLRDLVLDASFGFVRRGKGDIFTPHQPEDGEGKGFLSGVLETERRYAMSARYQVSRDCFVGFEGVLSARRNVGRVLGFSTDEQYFRLFLDVNY